MQEKLKEAKGRLSLHSEEEYEGFEVQEVRQSREVDVSQCWPLGGEHLFSSPFLHPSPMYLQLNPSSPTRNPPPKGEIRMIDETAFSGPA